MGLPESEGGTRGLALVKTDAIRRLVRHVHRLNPDEVRYAATISVWLRWLVLAAAAFQVTYRPPAEHTATFAGLALALGVLNGALHYRLITNRPIARHHLLGIGAVDIVVVTAAIIAHGGFSSFIFVAYFPAVSVFALIGSPTLALVSVTTVAGVYTTVCLTVDPGLDFDAKDEKALLWRVVVMYAIVASIAMFSWFVHALRQDAVERERALQRERVELSQAIHDTTAQTAYMIGLGIDAATELAGDSNEELRATLAATSELSRSAMWDLRRPIDMGHIFEGRGLGRVLQSHTATFTGITSVPAEMSQSGTEPPLATETRTRLFSIAHNALTNAFRHAHASKVDVRLNFAPERIELSISDDGVGLPEGYEEGGHGFRGMQADAEALGGELIVESGGQENGTTVTCVVPYRNTG